MTDLPPPRPPETLEETMARLQQHRPEPAPQGQAPGQPEAEFVPPVDAAAPFPGISTLASAPPASAPPWSPVAGQPQPQPQQYAQPQYPQQSYPQQHAGYAAPASDGGGYGPAYVPVGSAPERKRSKKAPWIVAGVGLVAAVVAGALVFNFLSSNGLTGGIDWSAYPGTSYSDPTEVLADTSFEELTEKATALETAYRDRLTEEFGLVWTQAYPRDSEQTTNGYGGDSLLYNYNSGEWQGSAKIDDPDARERVYEIFLEVVAEAGIEDSYLANEIYEGDDEASKEQFGAPFGSEQAVWTMAASGLSRSFTFSTKVFDQSYPLDKSFTGDVWFRLDDVGSDNFHVTFTAWAYLLLSTEDRAEYIERLKPYEGLELPEPR